MNILYQTDDRYAPYTGVSIYSLLENNKELDSIRIFVIDDSISEENRKRMTECVSSYQRDLIFISAGDMMADPAVRDIQNYRGTRKNTHSFLKMLSIDRLPDDVDHILYLDGDTLVLGNLRELTSSDIGDNVIAMALDSLVDKNKEMIGFDRSDKYYNSGVIYIDVNKWKTKGCGKRVIDHAMHHVYGTVDQDLLNVEFKDEIFTLPPQYNFQPHHIAYNDSDYFAVITHKNGYYYSADEIDRARNDIRIMHFFRYLGEQPWHLDNLHPCTPTFDRYLKDSPWSDYEKTESNKGLIFAIEKVLYKIMPQRAFLRLFMAMFTLKLRNDIRRQLSCHE